MIRQFERTINPTYQLAIMDLDNFNGGSTFDTGNPYYNFSQFSLDDSHFQHVQHTEPYMEHLANTFNTDLAWPHKCCLAIY